MVSTTDVLAFLLILGEVTYMTIDELVDVISCQLDLLLRNDVSPRNFSALEVGNPDDSDIFNFGNGPDQVFQLGRWHLVCLGRIFYIVKHNGLE